MRTRRRIAALVVSAAALGVGFVALPSSAAAAPPVVPTCAFPNTPGSDSCASLKVDGVAPPVGAAYENIKLGVRVRSQFTPATSETTSVNLRVRRRHRAEPGGDPVVSLVGVDGQEHLRRV